MHYANGREAKVGDLVRGKGYNLKHVFTGLLITANPGASACNCSVATVGPRANVKVHFYGGVTDESRKLFSDGGNFNHTVEADIEYGQLDAFVAIDPQTGDILRPQISAGEEIIGEPI